MVDINIREEKMKEARMATPFRDFIKEIASRLPIVFNRHNGLTSKYAPRSDRTGDIITSKQHQEQRDDLRNRGKPYDFTMSFVDNLKMLFHEVPRANLRNERSENCDYADVCLNSKNAYLSSTVINGSENVLYSFSVKDHSLNVFNSVMVWNDSENVYFSTGIIHSFNIFYSKFILNSSDVRFSTNLVGCHECILCHDLENASYCIQNKNYSKEEYMQQKEELLRQKTQFITRYQSLAHAGNNFGSTRVEGNFLLECEDATESNLCYNVKNGRNLILVGSRGGTENAFDCFTGGSPTGLDFYGVMGAGNAQKVFNSTGVDVSSNIYYSCNLVSCLFCLACNGLSNSQFCILNKEYPKEERFVLADKIFAQMEKEGVLGKFFPGSLNPMYFNDTMASLIEDFSKEEIVGEGFLWRDEKIKIDIPESVDVISTSALQNFQFFDAEGKRVINSQVLNKVIKDTQGDYYKIIPLELSFLQKYGLPLPELHRLERIKLGFKFK